MSESASGKTSIWKKIRTPGGFVAMFLLVAKSIIEDWGKAKTFFEHVPLIAKILSNRTTTPILLIVGLGLIFWALIDLRKDKSESTKLILESLGTACVVSAIVVLLAIVAVYGEKSQEGKRTANSFTVFEEFGPIHRVHPELGDAVADVVADGTYEARHEHATVLWSKRFGGWIIWPIDPDEGWINYPELDWDEGNDSDADSEKVIGRKAPPGLYQPRGGLAILFHQDLDNWIKKVGWRKSQRGYNDQRSIHLQEFQNGWIIGNFRLWSKSPDGKVLVLFKNKTRDSRAVDIAPECTNIPPH